MTITVAWIRRLKDTEELIVASDSRLRNQGAMNQCQKIFPLDRGDCCLGFCGSAQIAYPLFVQTASALNHHLKTRSRALDVSQLGGFVGKILNNLVHSWKDIKRSEKTEALEDTRIFFGGWSFEANRFLLGNFIYREDKFNYHQEKMRTIFPWREKGKSLLFIGDYEEDYRRELASIMERKFGKAKKRGVHIDILFDFEPVEALFNLLQSENAGSLTAIGGAPQMLKIYRYASCLPFVIRTSEKKHFLFGRELFLWEKTENPILDLSKAGCSVSYPGQMIPLPPDVMPASKKRKGRADTTGPIL